MLFSLFQVIYFLENSYQLRLSMKMCQFIFHMGGVILLKNILFRIAIPSTVFAMIEFVPSYMLRGKLITLNEFLIKTLGGNTYWFNSALVVAEILILIMLLSRKKNIWFYFSCSIVIFGIGYYLCSNGIELQHNYWEFNQALLAIIFLALGGVYWKYEAKIDKLINKYVACFLIVAYFGCVILFREKCKVLISTLSVNIPGVFLSLLGTIAFVYILKQIKIKIKLFDFLGQNTIGFYFMSGALPIVLSGVANKFISGNVAGLLVVSALSISIAYILVIIINRFLPFLFDFRTIKDFSLCRKKESE